MSGQTQHFVKVEARGPTSDAAQQDALWMYYQIQSGRGDYIFTWSKLITETLEQGVKYVQS